MSDEQKYEIRPVSLVVAPDGECLFSELVTRVEIVDEGAGEFVKVTQSRSEGDLQIDPSEWFVLREAIDQMIKQCR